MRFGEPQLFSYGKSLGCHGEAALVTIATKTSFQVTSSVSGLNGFTGVEVLQTQHNHYPTSLLGRHQRTQFAPKTTVI